MKTLFVMLTLTITMMLAGCGMVMVEHEESTVAFGSSTKLALRQQILNPEAGNDAPVVGLDGRYADAVAKKYHEGPRTEPDKGQSVSEVIIEAR